MNVRAGVTALLCPIPYPGATLWALFIDDKHMVSEGHPGFGIQPLDW